MFASIWIHPNSRHIFLSKNGTLRLRGSGLRNGHQRDTYSGKPCTCGADHIFDFIRQNDFLSQSPDALAAKQNPPDVKSVFERLPEILDFPRTNPLSCSVTDGKKAFL
jgi:hypothetical protein